MVGLADNFADNFPTATFRRDDAVIARYLGATAIPGLLRGDMAPVVEERRGGLTSLAEAMCSISRIFWYEHKARSLSTRVSQSRSQMTAQLDQGNSEAVDLLVKEAHSYAKAQKRCLKRAKAIREQLPPRRQFQRSVATYLEETAHQITVERQERMRAFLAPVPVNAVKELAEKAATIETVTQAMKDDQPHCTICLGEFEDDGETTELPCGHRFHKACIGAWFKMKPTCCVCKADIRDAKPKPEPASEDAAPAPGKVRCVCCNHDYNKSYYFKKHIHTKKHLKNATLHGNTTIAV